MIFLNTMQRYVNLRLFRHVNTHTKSQYLIGLSEHPDLTIETIESLPDYPWEWDTIDAHPNFRLAWVERFPNKPWDWTRLHKNKKFSFEFVNRFRDKPWNWSTLSRKATIEDLNAFPDFPWDWIAATVCSDISTEEMVKNTHFPWRVDLIGFNDIENEDLEFLYHYKDDFTMENWIDFTTTARWEIIKQSFDLYWVAEMIKFDDVVFKQDDISFFRNHIDADWNWAVLSLIVPFELIRTNLDLPWNYELVSMNDSVMYDDVERNKHLITWELMNTPCEPVDRIIRKWIAASCIKRYFKRAISDPSYKMCRDRLKKEFSDLYINVFF